MTFYADPVAIGRLSNQLDRLGKDADKAKTYVEKFTKLEYGEGWLNKTKGGHESVVKEVTGWLKKLEDPVAASTSTAIDKAAAYYARTDADNEKVVDAALPEHEVKLSNPGSAYWVKYADVPAFGDVAEPTDSLKSIPDYNKHEDYDYDPSWTDAFSFGGAARDAIWGATSVLAWIGWLDRAYDPLESWVKPITGDWAGLRGCATGFRNLAECMEAMSDNLYHSRLTLGGAWQGRAADACSVHLGDIQTTISGDTPADLRKIAQHYQKAADGANDLGAAVGTLITDLMEAAAIFMLEITAAVVTSETVVGGVIFSAAALYEAKVIVGLVCDIVDLYSRLENLLDATDSAMNNFGLIDAGKAGLPGISDVTKPPSLPG